MNPIFWDTLIISMALLAGLNIWAIIGLVVLFLIDEETVTYGETLMKCIFFPLPAAAFILEYVDSKKQESG